jgi:hypothetical protein
VDKFFDANMYRSKSAPLSPGPVIFNGPLKYKSSPASSYDPAWMVFKETAKILTVYTGDPTKDSTAVVSVGFIDVRNATLKSKQSAKRVYLDIVTQSLVSHKFSFESIEEAMKLVEAIDRCIGHAELNPTSSSESIPLPSQSQPKLLSSTPTRSVKFSTPPPSTKSDIYSPPISSKSEPAMPEIFSEPTKSRQTRSDSHSSNHSDGVKLFQKKPSSKSIQKQETEISFLDYVILDSHRRKTSLRSVSKSASLAIYVTPDFGNLDSKNVVSDLLKRDGDFLKNRGIKIAVMSSGSAKGHQSSAKDVAFLEDQTGTLIRWLCEKPRKMGAEDNVAPDSAFLLLDQTKDIIFSASISDKSRPAMDEIVEAVEFYILD